MNEGEQRLLVENHIEAVSATLSLIMHAKDGIPTNIIEQLYAEMTPRQRLLSTHQEPFEEACEILGVPNDRRSILFEQFRTQYENIMLKLDSDLENALESFAENSDAPGLRLR